MTTIAHPGFADPVADSQATFRAVLDAMARPGRIHRVEAPHQPPPGLDRSTAAVLLSLVDAETPLWLDPAGAGVGDWIRFHCSAPLVGIGQARFGLALGPAPLASLPTGSDDAPETGATLILQVRELGEGAALRLAGPGLAAPATLAVQSLPEGFAGFWRANRALFPRGIDVILCAGNRLAALPRTVAIEEA